MNAELTALKSEIAAGNELAREKTLSAELHDRLFDARSHMRNLRKQLCDAEEENRALKRQLAMAGMPVIPRRQAEDEGCS